MGHAHCEVREGIGRSGQQSHATKNNSLGDFVRSKLPANVTKKTTFCSKIDDFI